MSEQVDWIENYKICTFYKFEQSIKAVCDRIPTRYPLDFDLSVFSLSRDQILYLFCELCWYD